MSEKILPVLTLKSANLLLKESVVIKSKHSCTSSTSDFDLDDDCVNIFQNGFWSTVESKNHQITNLQKSQSPVTSDLGDSNRGSSPEEESIINQQSPDHIFKKDDIIILKDDAIIPKEATTEKVELPNLTIKIEKSKNLPKQGECFHGCFIKMHNYHYKVIIFVSCITQVPINEYLGPNK